MDADEGAPTAKPDRRFLILVLVLVFVLAMVAAPRDLLDSTPVVLVTVVAVTCFFAWMFVHEVRAALRAGADGGEAVVHALQQMGRVYLGRRPKGPPPHW